MVKKELIKDNEELKKSIYYYWKALEGVERGLLFRKIAVELVNNSKLLSFIIDKSNDNEISNSFIRDSSDNEFLPLFTDISEMNKCLDILNPNSDPVTIVETFDFYVNIIRDYEIVKGIVINPCTDNGFTVCRESIEDWYDGVEIKHVPIALKDKIIDVLKKDIEVDKAWVTINDNDVHRIILSTYDGVDNIKKELSNMLELDELEVIMVDDQNTKNLQPIYVREKSLFN